LRQMWCKTLTQSVNLIGTLMLTVGHVVCSKRFKNPRRCPFGRPYSSVLTGSKKLGCRTKMKRSDGDSGKELVIN